MKLIPGLGHEDFQLLTEKHHGAVSSKLCNISSLPIWHCFDLKLLVPWKGNQDWEWGWLLLLFFNKNTTMFCCSPCLMYWCLVK